MASVSSTSSLGNTSLRGFGGMVSGIDRDEIIEQMTLGTTTKINNAKKEITSLQWKQEAFRNISDKIIGMEDDYFSFSSASSLVDPTIFAKSLVTVHGSEKSSKYVTASGTSDLVDSISISAVKRLATSTVLRSDSYTGGALQTSLSNFTDTKLESSNLAGRKITFGQLVKSDTDGNKWMNETTFTFATECKVRDENGNVVKEADGKTDKTEKIEYILPETDDISDPEYIKKVKTLVNQLNNSLKDLGDDKKIGDTAIADAIQFVYDENTGTIGIEELKDDAGNSKMGDYTIRTSTSSALSALGYNNQGATEGSLKVSALNTNLAPGNLQKNTITRTNALQGLSGKKVSFVYNGSQKDIELLTKEERETIESMQAAGKSAEEQLAVMAKGLQERLDRAFGQGNVQVSLAGCTLNNDGTVTKDPSFDNKGGLIKQGSLQFTTQDPTSSVSIRSGDDSVLKCLDIGYGASSRVNISGSLSSNADKLGNFTDADLAAGITINGVTIGGITKDTSISSILSKINSSDAGVKATYVEATGQFMLVSSETGANRKIELGVEGGNNKLTNALFGFTEDGSKNGGVVEGQDALIEVSYGNGVNVELNRSSNTFNLEGLTVTVTGTFGGEYQEVDGKEVWKSDTADTVSFTAKADVDKVTERVKTFFESFNAIAEEVNNQLTTRPDSSYGPLTDEQKAEMTETSIENWETKAKQGILYGDSTIRDLSVDIQGIFVKLMNNGASYDDLSKIGITYSDDYKDGGKLIFDEAKFRSAMESDPELVSNIFAGGGGVSKGLASIVSETFTPYATRYASNNAAISGGRGSYGRLIEEAGSEKTPTTLLNNFIYNQIKEMQDKITELRSRLVTEQDRYIKQFSSMENLISQMNSQSSWLSQITG